MPAIAEFIHCLLEQFIYLKHKLFPCIFKRPTQDRDDDAGESRLDVGFTSGGSDTTHTPNFLNVFQPEDGGIFSFRPTPPLPSRIDNHLQPPQSCKRKALLIGVEDDDCRGPHKDVRDMRQFIINRWNYHPDDIILMMNTEDPERLAVQPTKENIEKHCKELVAGACKGDRFFFHFAGHTRQKKAKGEEEEDGKDEYIVTSDNDIIQDNDLRMMLVDPLPAGAKFVAVFDACNSATLLDLVHHRCNRVYVPWVNKGTRRTQSQWNKVVRRCAFDGPLKSASMDAQENVGLPAISFSPRNSMSSGSVMLSPTTLPAEVVAEVFEVSESVAGPSRRSTSTAAGTAPDGTGRLFNWFETPMPVYDSPFSHFCTGHCRTKNFKLYLQESHLSDMADVICLSSAKDSQRSWGSMTQILIEFLEKTPNATIREVLTAVSHQFHAFYIIMHQTAREYKERKRDVDQKKKRPKIRRTVETDNFQDPQISSHKPLDMSRLWEM